MIKLALGHQITNKKNYLLNIRSRVNEIRAAEFLKRLIRQGTKIAKELQRRTLEYVKESLFSGESHPDATRRKFRPNRQKIRNLVSSVRNELRFSKIDQENLQHLAKEWRKWGDVHFLPRYLVCYYSFNRNRFYIICNIEFALYEKRAN